MSATTIAEPRELGRRGIERQHLAAILVARQVADRRTSGRQLLLAQDDRQACTTFVGGAQQRAQAPSRRLDVDCDALIPEAFRDRQSRADGALI